MPSVTTGSTGIPSVSTYLRACSSAPSTPASSRLASITRWQFSRVRGSCRNTATSIRRHWTAICSGGHSKCSQERYDKMGNQLILAWPVAEGLCVACEWYEVSRLSNQCRKPLRNLGEKRIFGRQRRQRNLLPMRWWRVDKAQREVDYVLTAGLSKNGQDSLQTLASRMCEAQIALTSALFWRAAGPTHSHHRTVLRRCSRWQRFRLLPPLRHRS